jgi:uncharacterized membrane protein YqaE (UPF0057 family)
LRHYFFKTIRQAYIWPDIFFDVLHYFSITSSQKNAEVADLKNPNMEQVIPAEFAGMSVDQLLNMTPGEYKKITGKKLGLKKTIAMKAAQKRIKKEMKRAEKGMDPSLDKGTYVLLAFFIPFLAVGLATDWEGSDWVICLLLSCLCWLPGFIYALSKRKKYYGA